MTCGGVFSSFYDGICCGMATEWLELALIIVKS